MTNSAAEPTATPPGVFLEIPAGRDAPARAREALAALSGRIGRRCLETLELVVSELMTNAVRHSGVAPGRPVGLDVTCGEDVITVAVTDPGPGFGHGAREPVPGAIGGWGLYLVGEVVDSWHVEDRDDGRGVRVVARIPRRG